MNESEIEKKIEYLKIHIQKIKSEKIKKQQKKYMHRLMKELLIYRSYKK